MYHGHVASITGGFAGDLHQQVVVNARTFRLRGQEVQCMNSELCFTYLRVVAVGELEVEGDTRGGLAGGDHVLSVCVVGVLLVQLPVPLGACSQWYSK